MGDDQKIICVDWPVVGGECLVEGGADESPAARFVTCSRGKKVAHSICIPAAAEPGLISPSGYLQQPMLSVISSQR